MKTVPMRPCFGRATRGFSLVELMVGLAIGMIGVVIMMQIFSVSEGYKRTTTGGDDAQNNGAISLYGLQRDLRMAGEGSNAFTDNAASTSAYSLIGCNLTLRAGVTINGLGPVTINSASVTSTKDANTDTLLIFYGNGNDGPEGDHIESQPATNTYTLAAFAAASAPSMAVQDYVVAHPTPRPSPCNLSMTQVSAVAGSNVTVSAGVAGMTGGALFNIGKPSGVGTPPRFIAYRVSGGALLMCDYMVSDCSSSASANWTTVASNIVSVRAQYGRDTTAGTMDGTVDVFDQTAPTNICDWVRMRAVRLAIVSRSAQLEKGAVTTAAPAWAGSAGNAIDLSADTSWQSYRYKVFETVVPLRNVAWLGAQAGC